MSFFTSDPFQTLTAAFSFGILLQAATGGAFILFKGHGSTLLQDGGRRLALLLFMIFAVLWAQLDFGTLLIPRTSPGICQGVLIFSTAADQLARISLEQFLLWTITKGTKMSLVAYMMQGVLIVRLVAGGIAVGFSRQSFEPTCVARTSFLPASIASLTLDLIIIGFLIIRAISLGMFGDMRDKQSSLKKGQSKAFILTTTGFVLWTATSVVMLLGVPGFILALKTAVPANALLILVGMVTVFCEALLSSHVQLSTTPESQSPYIGPETTSRELPRGLVGSGSPRSGNRFTMGGRLHVVNETPQESPSHQNRDNRGFTRLGDDVSRFGASNQGQSTSYGPGYRGSSGLFGLNVAPRIGHDQTDGNLSAVLPAADRTDEAVVAKKSLFSWSSSKPTANIRARGISKPIIVDDGSDNMPFSRVLTTDLATAAKNERERREAAAFGQLNPLVSNPVTSQEYAPIARQNPYTSVLRKEMAYSPNARLSTVPGSTTSSLSPMGVGSTTSMSISPGREEVRRRSPRNDIPFETTLSEKPLPPVKLQRSNTIGLPSGPRPQKLAAVVTSKQVVEDASTIMRMNNIVYDNPDVVNAIMMEAQKSYQAQQRPKTAGLPLASFSADILSADSMIHRPRPYSRKYAETDRALFPAEPSHRRAKSAGTLLTIRSSIFSSFPSTPATISPLPALPRSAAELKKLFPINSTGKSVNEKIELLFPAPPISLLRNRRSSVPSVPRVPSMFMVDSDTSHSRSPTIDLQPSNRASKRSTVTSFALLPFTITDTSFLAIQDRGLAISHFSQSTVSHVTNLSLEARTFEGFHANNLSLEAKTFEGFKKSTAVTPVTLNQSSTASSPINYQHSFPIVTKTGSTSHARNTSIPQRSSTVGSVGSSGSREEDASTEWASIHSRVPPVDLKQARLNARSTFIRGIVHDNDQNFSFQALVSPTGTESSEVTDIIPVMLDDGRTDYSSYANSISSRMSSARNSVDLDTPTNIKPVNSLFHHRLGDSLPTFSVREAQTITRKNSAPAPLQLNRIGRPTNYVVELAELSPVTPPEKAIEEIMVQLDNFDDSERESVDFVSLDRDTRQLQIQDRLRLLENLEREMDEQEDQWQNLNLNRNSVSTTMTNTPANTDFTRNPSTRTSRIMSYVSTRSERFRSMQVRGDESSVTNSGSSSENSRASMWQTRLADAQLSYLENAPSLLRNSLNFLAMPSRQIASPTPLDSDESIEIELDLSTGSDASDIEYAYSSAQTPTKTPAKLWGYGAPSPPAPVGRLWSHPYEEKKSASPEPPAKNMRIMQRFNVLPLQLSSTDLWTKPSMSSNPRIVTGLWRSNLVRPKSIVTKRASVRPARSNRRMTILPDIVESPVPVPNNEKTLGIFKFAWGETSDQPTYQPTFVPVPFSNFTTNSRLNARSMQLEPEGTEYSSSFFDDYDEEDSQDSDMSSYYSEDEFDNREEEFNDNTLFEIADLLQSNAVPSRQSLFSPETIVEDYADDSDLVEVAESDMRFLQAPVRLPIQPLSYSPKPSPRFENFIHSPKPSPRYENFNVEDRYMEPDIYSASDNDESLDQFDDEFIIQMEPTFENFAPESFSSEEDFYSDSDDESLVDLGLILEPEVEVEIQPTTNKGLWSLQDPDTNESSFGLFSLTNRTLTIRGADLAPQNVGFARTPRDFSIQLPQLSSQDMWSKPEAAKEERVWILASLVNDAPAPTLTQFLWALPSKVDKPANKGLFKMPAQPTTDRSTSLEPAAINMVSKPRIQQSSLPTLESTTLWNGTQNLPIEHHWISESSFSPPSPSMYSPSPMTGTTTSTDRSSYDLFDTSSIRTTSTKASSLWASMSSIATPTWRDRESQSAKKASSPTLSISEFRKSALSPSDAVSAREAEMNSRIPKLRRQKSQEGRWKREDAKEAFRANKIVEEEESEDEGAKRAHGMEFAAIRASLRPSARRPLKPIAKPKYQRIQSTKADWKFALAEAIAAGPQKPVRKVITKEDWMAELNKKAIIVGPVNAKKERPAVTGEAEWVAALNEAVAAGALHKPKRPTVLKDDWMRELNSKAIIIGPAHAQKTRPVSDEADWEAALAEAMEKSGIVNKAPVVNLWTSPSEITVPSATALWSKTEVVERPAAIFSISIPNIRKVLPAENPNFSTLQSTNLWKPNQVLLTEINWISVQTPSIKASAPKTWTLRQPSTTLPTTKSDLWTHPIPCTPTTPTLFTISAPHIRKALPVENPNFSILQSTNLWKSTQVLPTEINWIISQVPSKQVSAPTAPKTWTLRQPSTTLPTTKLTLWTLPTPITPTTPAIFAMPAPHIRKALPAENANFSILQSTALWKQDPVLSSPIHWLSHSRSLTSISPSLSQTSTAKTWTPRLRSFTSPLNTKGLWKLNSSTSDDPLTPTNLFTSSSTSFPTKKFTTPANYQPLQPLTSTQLFTPIPEVEKPLRTHWLLRSVSEPKIASPRPVVLPVQSQENVGRERSMTWSSSLSSRAVASDIREEKGLWTPSSNAIIFKDLKESELFNNASSEIWVRKQRSASEPVVVFSHQNEKLWESSSRSRSEGVESGRDWMMVHVA